MAVMGRKKAMVKRMVENLRIQKKEWSEEEKKRIEEQKKPISEEEHRNRLEELKKIGLIK